AKKHDLEFEVKRLHFLNKEEAINWMLDNQLGRRNLSPQQRVDVIFQAEELIKIIYEKGKVKQFSELKHQKSSFGATDQNDKKPHNSREEIAKLAKTSGATVQRMKKIKKENPEAYKEVVNDNQSVFEAYKNLPTVVNKQAEKEGFVKKHERGDVKTKKEEPSEKAVKKRKSSQLYDFENPEITAKERENAMFGANVETLFMHLAEMESFYGRTKNVEDVVKEAVKRDQSSMKDYKEVLEKIIKLMEE